MVRLQLFDGPDCNYLIGKAATIGLVKLQLFDGPDYNYLIGQAATIGFVRLQLFNGPGCNYLIGQAATIGLVRMLLFDWAGCNYWNVNMQANASAELPVTGLRNMKLLIYEICFVTAQFQAGGAKRWGGFL